MDRAARRMRVIFVILPAAFMAVLLVVPAFQGLLLSFDAHGRPSLANYIALAGDPMFWRSLANNLTVPIGSLALELLLGLALALFLTSRRRPGPVVEIAAILPFAIPEIVVLALARYIFIPRGYLNGVLAAAGIAPLGWVRPGSILALFTVILVDAWHVFRAGTSLHELRTGLRPEMIFGVELDDAAPDVVGTLFEDTVDNERRTQPGAQTEKQHSSALITPQGLHGGVIHHFDWASKRFLEIEADPSFSQVVRLGDWLAM